MASIKVMFRLSTVDGREGSVVYRVMHQRKMRVIHSGHRLFPAEWNPERGAVIVPPAGERRAAVLAARERIARDVERLRRIVRRLDAAGVPYTADDVADGFRLYMGRYSLSAFMENIITRMWRIGRVRTSETYGSALKSFRKFLRERPDFCPGQSDNGDIMLDCITPRIMEDYEAWHRSRGVAPNTISFYMRILRAVYNRAVEDGAVDDLHPFRRVYTGVDKTVKRALPLRVISRINALDLTWWPCLDHARNMFMLSFLLRGMSLVDMAFLKKTDLHSGYVVYRRRKTGQRLTVKWTPEMQAILDRYPENESDYLLPIIRRRGLNERCAYHNAGYNINHNLKKIASRIGLAVPLTLYVARHSWASAARAKGIPLAVISEGMGHDSEATTQIYLAALDTSAVDKANALIIKSIQ